MTQQQRKFKVTPGQVFLAREYIRRKGNPALVDPKIIAVANLPLDEVQDEWDSLGVTEEKIQAAQILIELRGGEEFVDPEIVAIAHAKVHSAAGK